jgi:hypothetical protein
MPANRRATAPSRNLKPAGPPAPERQQEPAAPARRYRPVTRKQRTFYMSDDLFGRIQAAVVFLAGPPEALTMTAFLERAADAELARLQRKYHHGKPFPRLREGAELRRGARPGGTRR